MAEIEPYQFQPLVNNTHHEDDFIPDLFHFFEVLSRTGEVWWCKCGNCCPQTTSDNSICCKEIRNLQNLMDELNENNSGCFTTHPGFISNCLDVWVIRASYHNYRSVYGDMEVDQNKRYRYTAYRNVVLLGWGWLGKNNRIKLPSCVLNRIREAYPSGNYTGHLPKLPFLR